MVGGVAFSFVYLWGYVCAFDFPQIGFLCFWIPKGSTYGRSWTIHIDLEQTNHCDFCNNSIFFCM
jgi:hypothetical protein